MEFIIGIILVIVAVIIYGMLSRKKIYKEVDRLESWKIEIMNRPVTDEMAMVKSLNMTGQTEELFERWRKQWDEIVTTELPNVEEALFDIEECADKFQFRKSRALVKQLHDRLQGIEDTIQTILQELKDLVGSEEKNRTEIEELKQEYREVKRALLAHSNSFGRAEGKMEKLLDETMIIFKEFDEAMSLGNIMSAREMVLAISGQLKLVQQLIEEVPQLLKECQVHIPNQLDELVVGIKEMKDEGFILSHLLLDKETTIIRDQLLDFLTLIENANIDPVKQGIADIKEKIESIYESLEKEALSKHFVLKERNIVHEDLDVLFEETKKTKEETEQVQLSYQISKTDLETQTDIEKQINELIKRLSAVQSSVEEKDMAYSLIRIELEDIKYQIESLKYSHQEFSNMLQTLRKDEVHAKEQLEEMRKMILEAKRLVQKSNLPGLPQTYLSKIQECNQNVKMVAEKLEEKPLHIPGLNEMLEQAFHVVKKLTVQTEEMVEQAYLVEQVIQYGNRYRGKYYQLAEQLDEAESSFRNYEYSLALEQAATALEKIEPGALKKIQYRLDSTNS
ncbi:septation ring formation regulator EzrA [Bacillus salitolerans]|uniref:Septation ring formation regulator EzrA n=1 Tax=Bacillus salitolerans TaxID=1437434 RepID=A0ABW4LVW0_9BACI